MTRGRFPVQGCGTTAAYKRGCRCEPCKKAKAAEWSAYHSASRSRGIRPGSHRRIWIEEVVELIQWGTSMQDVARRLGVRVASIERAALRHGTPEERAVLRRAMEGLSRHRSAAA